MSVHLYCYGLSSFPRGDWVCNTCLEFGERGKDLRCPFCNIRGGAMKVSSLKADTNIFQETNPNFHNFLKSYSNEDLQKTSKSRSLKSLQPPKSTSTVILKDKKSEKTQNEQNSNLGKFLFHKDNENNILDVNSDEPKPSYVWAHITCALFIPELYFKDSANVNNIAGLLRILKSSEVF